MVSTAALLYFGGGTVLFFFWAYGIVSFVQDLKNKVVPGVRGYLRQRRAEAEEAAEQREREEREKQLY